MVNNYRDKPRAVHGTRCSWVRAGDLFSATGGHKKKQTSHIVGWSGGWVGMGGGNGRTAKFSVPKLWMFGSFDFGCLDVCIFCSRIDEHGVHCNGLDVWMFGCVGVRDSSYYLL